MAAPSVTVIIPHYNDNARLLHCLEALEAQDYEGEFEILVVDNGSDADPELTGRAQLLTEPVPGSYAARNRAIEAATGTLLAFTDSDCRPATNWISAGAAALLTDESIGLVGGKVRIVNMSNRPPSLAAMLEIATAFPQERYIRNGNYAATANMFTRSSVLEHVGPFDARLRSGGDADWGQRVARAGYRLHFEASARVDHPARPTHMDIITKNRRVVGGHRDRNPGWANAIVFSLRHLKPPRAQIMASIRANQFDPLQRTKLVLYSIYLNWWIAFERLRIQASKEDSTRS